MGSIAKAYISGFLCRLCSEIHKVVVHIYSNSGKKLSIDEKINGYLPITISPTDPLPKTICQSCLRRVEEHYDLLIRLSGIRQKQLNPDVIHHETKKIVGSCLLDTASPQLWLPLVSKNVLVSLQANYAYILCLSQRRNGLNNDWQKPALLRTDFNEIHHETKKIVGSCLLDTASPQLWLPLVSKNVLVSLQANYAYILCLSQRRNGLNNDWQKPALLRTDFNEIHHETKKIVGSCLLDTASPQLWLPLVSKNVLVSLQANYAYILCLSQRRNGLNNDWQKPALLRTDFNEIHHETKKIVGSCLLDTASPQLWLPLVSKNVLVSLQANYAYILCLSQRRNGLNNDWQKPALLRTDFNEIHHETKKIVGSCLLDTASPQLWLPLVSKNVLVSLQANYAYILCLSQRRNGLNNDWQKPALLRTDFNEVNQKHKLRLQHT